MYKTNMRKPSHKNKLRLRITTIIALTALLLAGGTSFIVQSGNSYAHTAQMLGGDTRNIRVNATPTPAGGDTGTFQTNASQIPGGDGGGAETGGTAGVGGVGEGGGGGGGGSTGATDGVGLTPEFVPGAANEPIISAGQLMIEYTTINGVQYQYNPNTGEMTSVTIDAQGTTTRSIDPVQDAQTYNAVKADLQSDPNSEPVKALTGTVTTQSTVDVYRSGNAQGPRLVVEPGGQAKPRPRLGEDIFPDQNNMIYPGKGGTSTFDSITQPSVWWKLPAGTQLPDGLLFRNDKLGHWLIEPSRPMTVDQYKQLLLQITGWTRVKK